MQANTPSSRWCYGIDRCEGHIFRVASPVWGSLPGFFVSVVLAPVDRRDLLQRPLIERIDRWPPLICSRRLGAMILRARQNARGPDHRQVSWGRIASPACSRGPPAERLPPLRRQNLINGYEAATTVSRLVSYQLESNLKPSTVSPAVPVPRHSWRYEGTPAAVEMAITRYGGPAFRRVQREYAATYRRHRRSGHWPASIQPSLVERETAGVGWGAGLPRGTARNLVEPGRLRVNAAPGAKVRDARNAGIRRLVPAPINVPNVLRRAQ